MISIHKLTKKFGKLQVLKGIDLAFECGQVTSVIGPNGSGKTTLIKSILGMVVPDSGDICMEGQSILKRWDYRSRIGYMPQIGRYPDNMKIGQLFKMMQNLRAPLGGQFDEQLMQAYRLHDLFGKPLRTLSGGTRQKVSASLAFLFNPDVLILDEPTAGLDPLAAEILKQHITDARAKGKLVIITSHIMSEVDEMANTLVYLMDGQVFFHKDIPTLKAEAGEERLGKAVAQLIKEKSHV